jgi:hypothetical protein
MASEGRPPLSARKTKPRATFSSGRNPSSYKTIIGNIKTEVNIT